MVDRQLLDAYWRALARVGSNASADALSSWQRVNPLSPEVSGASWLAHVLSIIRGQRGQARSIAAAFYRLHRALETGRTFPPLTGESFGDVSLGDLRNEWARLTGTIHNGSADDATTVPVDDFEWPTEPTDDFDRAATISMVSQGLAPVYKRLSQVGSATGRGRLDDPDFLADLNETMKNAGKRAAMAADREVQRGARNLIDQTSLADRRVIGWARVTDGNPCGFCAMLASRGAVYRSRASAGVRGLGGAGLPDVHRPDLEKYHTGCHCQTVPVYTRTDFLTPEAERYAREWREVTKGTTGDEARRVWRRYIESQRNSR